LKSTIKASEGLIREIEIEVPTETVDATFAEIYHRYRKEAKIPGFRPGKAPLAMIKSRFRDAIYDDVLEELIRNSYPQAIKELELDVISRPTIPKYELEEGNPLKYIAKIEVMPVIEKIICDGFELPVIEVEVTDDDVKTVIEYLRKKHSEIRPVDRPASDTDVLEADLIKLEDPSNILKGNEFKGNEVDLSSPTTVKEFREALIGIKTGEDREVTVNYPSDYSDDHFAGKMLKYRCRVTAVKERILPPEDDAFAKQVGAETYLELRLKIREDLKKQKQSDQDKWKRSELTRQFLAKNPVTIPEVMLEDYLNRVVEDHKKNYKDSDEKKVREQYRPMGINWISWNLLMNRLAELEKIEVLPIDTENWIKRFAENYRMEIDKAREALAKSGRIQEIRESILEDKIFDFLFSKVTYKPMPAEPSKPAGDENEDI
jgi:trigger factor